MSCDRHATLTPAPLFAATPCWQHAAACKKNQPDSNITPPRRTGLFPSNLHALHAKKRGGTSPPSHKDPIPEGLELNTSTDHNLVHVAVVTLSSVQVVVISFEVLVVDVQLRSGSIDVLLETNRPDSQFSVLEIVFSSGVLAPEVGGAERRKLAVNTTCDAPSMRLIRWESS